MTGLEKLQETLRGAGLRPKDYLGQNFLIDEEVLSEIIQSAEIVPTDKILEVGPGLGVLTSELVSRAGEIIAIEKDDSLVNYLQRKFRNQKNLQIIEQDILKYDLSLLPKNYKLVANIPYYLTSKLIQNFLESKNRPKFMILMIQKEVGERIIAEPGELSLLGLSVQIYADAEILVWVSKQSFFPIPKVDSVIIKITPRNKYPEITDYKLFFRILKVAFAGKRKQVHNTLMNGLKLEKSKLLQLLTRAGIEPTERPQDIEIGQWIKFYQEIQKSEN